MEHVQANQSLGSWALGNLSLSSCGVLTAIHRGVMTEPHQEDVRDQVKLWDAN